MLPDIREGATEDKVARAPQIVKIDDLVMLFPIILMGRPIRSLEDSEVPPPVRRPSMQEVNPNVTLVNPNRQSRNVSETNREVTRGPHDASPIERSGPLNPLIEARFERLKVGHERDEYRLNANMLNLRSTRQG